MSALAPLIARFERLDRALDEALTGWEFRPHRRKRREQTSSACVLDDETIRRASLSVLSALRSSLIEDEDAFGALDYYQLKSRSKLTDEILGLTLNELIPSHLRTRNDGVRRYYFLRRELRTAILMKVQIMKRVA